MDRKQTRTLLLLGCAVLAAMLLFFLQAHPITVYDTDDWLYLGYARSLLPDMQEWNPARILPELLIPFCSAAAAQLVYPFTRDLMGALSLVYGVVVSLCITGYVVLFALFLMRRVKASPAAAAVGSALFLLLHFLIFRYEGYQNEYLFRAADSTCYFYYIIPTLLNLSLVFLLESCPRLTRWTAPDHPLQTGLVVFAVYFAVFSNLFSSHLLAIWAGLGLLGAAARLRGQRPLPLRQLARDQLCPLTVLALWGVSALCEGFGGRAQYPTDTPFPTSLVETCYHLKNTLARCNPVFWAAVALTVALCAAQLAADWRHHRPLNRFFALLGQAVCFTALSGVYLLLLCAKVASYYSSRSDVLLGLLAPVLAVGCALLSWLLTRHLGGLAVAPLCLCLLFCQCNTTAVTYRDSVYEASCWQSARAFSSGLVEQVLEADRRGVDEVSVSIPCYGGDNFPLTSDRGQTIGDTLYHFRLTARRVRVTFVVDEAMPLP